VRAKGTRGSDLRPAHLCGCDLRPSNARATRETSRAYGSAPGNSLPLCFV
jgi:hypothetical protein